MAYESVILCGKNIKQTQIRLNMRAQRRNPEFKLLAIQFIYTAFFQIGINETFYQIGFSSHNIPSI